MNRQKARRPGGATRRSLELHVLGLFVAAVGLAAIVPGPAGAASLPSNCRERGRRHVHVLVQRHQRYGRSGPDLRGAERRDGGHHRGLGGTGRGHRRSRGRPGRLQRWHGGRAPGPRPGRPRRGEANRTGRRVQRRGHRRTSRGGIRRCRRWGRHRCPARRRRPVRPHRCRRWWGRKCVQLGHDRERVRRLDHRPRRRRRGGGRCSERRLQRIAMAGLWPGRLG